MKLPLLEAVQRALNTRKKNGDKVSGSDEYTFFKSAERPNVIGVGSKEQE